MSAYRSLSTSLSAELDLERNRTEEVAARISQIPIPLRDVAVLLDVRAAALEVTAEWKFETDGVEEALQVVEESRNFALNEGLVSAVRHLSALRVVYLIADERIDQGARAWRGAGLPEDVANLLDLDTQSWREMEAISCARIRLLTAQGEFDSARVVAAHLCEVARKRGLARNTHAVPGVCGWGWNTAPGARTTPRRGCSSTCARSAQRDYIKPLVRERETSAQVMKTLLGLDLQANIGEIANAVLEQLGTTVADAPQAQHYTAREIEVLEGLGRGERDKEIARRLGITEYGVRYHLKNIYRKLGATGRVDAVRRARSGGVIRRRTTETGSGNC